MLFCTAVVVEGRKVEAEMLSKAAEATEELRKETGNKDATIVYNPRKDDEIIRVHTSFMHAPRTIWEDAVPCSHLLHYKE
jgi:hypothetical protein